MAKDEQKETKETKKPVVKKAAAAKSKKRWCQIVAPKSFDSMVLGESHVDVPEKLIGKTITSNLMTLTGDMRNNGVEIRFDVISTVEGKGMAVVTGYELLPSTMKRLVRRGRAKVGDSFVVRTSTGRLVRIKPVVMTTNPASSGACTEIRLAVRERAKQIISSMSFDVLIQDIIGYKFQRALKDVANKVHPVKNVEIRMCNLLPAGAIAPDDAERVNVIENETATATQDEEPAAEDDKFPTEDTTEEA